MLKANTHTVQNKQENKTVHQHNSHFFFSHVHSLLHSLVISLLLQVYCPDLFCGLFPQCATVTWLGRASSRRKASTSARPTTSVCTARGATAATASSRGRWSRLWGELTTPSASSAVFAGTWLTLTRMRAYTHTQMHAVDSSCCVRYCLLSTCNEGGRCYFCELSDFYILLYLYFPFLNIFKAV